MSTIATRSYMSIRIHLRFWISLWGVLLTIVLNLPLIKAEARSSESRLVIPAIGLNAPIQKVGLRPDGSMQVPQKNPWESVGLFDEGILPGDMGSAVIDGHLDRPHGYPAVFWNLHRLHNGNTIFIQQPGYRTLRFHVIDLHYYAPGKAPNQQIFGDQSGRYLKLITCAGDWIPAQHQTTLRLVVSAKLG